MAENKEIVFGVEVDGVEKGINSLKDLKKAIKDAKDEQLKASTAYGEGSTEYIKATKAVANLKDKMEDLSDSTQSLKGSGVEGLTSSFGLLGDGLKSFDLDKIKTGFKGVGSAMSAIPIFLIISGVTLLAEKFGVIEIVVDAVVDTFYALTDALGITNKAQEDLTKSTIDGLKSQQKEVEERYNSEIKLAKASGTNTAQLEIDKAKSVENSISLQISALQKLSIDKKVLNEEEKKEYKDLQIELLKASGDRNALEIANEKAKNDEINKLSLDFVSKVNASSKALENAKLSDREREIEAIKERSRVELEALSLSGAKVVSNEASYRQLKESEKNTNELAQIEINKINAKYYAIDLANKKKIADDKAKIEKELSEKIESLELETAIRRNKFDAEIKSNQETETANELQIKIDSINEEDLQRAIKANKDKEQREKDYIEDEKERELKYLRTRQSLTAAQQLTDIFFIYQLNKNKGNAAAELEIRKKQFNVNKSFGIVNATIDGIQAVQKSLNNPYPLNIFLAAISGIAAAANIAKIASTKFDGGSASGGASVSVPSSPNLSSAPVISTNENNLNKQTQFDQKGNKLPTNSSQTINVNASVGVDEINEKQYRVQVIETRAKF